VAYLKALVLPVAVGTLMATFVFGGPVDLLGARLAEQTISHAAVNGGPTEAGAIALLGSAAWLLGGRLRKRVQPPR
jgi:hypothetical protein